MTVACRFISAGQLLFLDRVQEQADEPSQRQNISRHLLSQLDQKVIEIMHMFTNSQALQSTCFDILQTIMRLSKRAYGQAVFDGESREVTFLSNVQKATPMDQFEWLCFCFVGGKQKSKERLTLCFVCNATFAPPKRPLRKNIIVMKKV